MIKIEVGVQVAFNLLDDATWFEVTDINGHTLTVKEVDDETDYATQHIDISAVKQARKAKGAYKLELSHDEMRYMADVVAGRHGADFWNDHARQMLVEKLKNMADEKLYGTPSAKGYSLSK